MDTHSKSDRPEKGSTGLSYRDAGVDIDAGNALVDRLKAITERTRRPEVLSGLGGFGGLFELPAGYRRPVLVSATDGVGTKLKLAMQLGLHRGVGIDLVAMCVNDLIVCGAEPLFFLDYYATGKLDVELAADVVAGIGAGCEQAGCALIGGETAEMPGMYEGGDYDLAGFAVGVVEKDSIIDQSKVQPGDRIIGLLSSGAHSNGFSLIRRVLELNEGAVEQSIDGEPLGRLLMAPTEIYVRAILALMQEVQIHAIAHITGGGIVENLPRVLPDDCHAVISRSAWRKPALFDWLQRAGDISDAEMLRTFNCGIGMIVCMPPDQADQALTLLSDHNRGAVELGLIEAAGTGAARVEFTE